jgi:hypothetical protein
MAPNSWDIGLFAQAFEVYGSGYKERMIKRDREAVNTN